MEDLFDFLDSQSREKPLGFQEVPKVNTEISIFDFFKKYCSPPLGAEYIFPNLFGKYGYTYSGICDGWKWNSEVKNATNEELLKMLSITLIYWSKNYELWNSKDKEKAGILDLFIGYCELKYYGYADVYNIEQIKNILQKVKNDLKTIKP